MTRRGFLSALAVAPVVTMAPVDAAPVLQAPFGVDFAWDAYPIYASDGIIEAAALRIAQIIDARAADFAINGHRPIYGPWPLEDDSFGDDDDW